MKRHITSGLTLIVLGVALSTGTSDAKAQKGFSFGGGSRSGGSSSMQRSGGGMSSLQRTSGGATTLQRTGGFGTQIQNKSLNGAVTKTGSKGSATNVRGLQQNRLPTGNVTQAIPNVAPKNLGTVKLNRVGNSLPAAGIQRKIEPSIGNVPAINKVTGNNAASRVLPGISARVKELTGNSAVNSSRQLGNALPTTLGKIAPKLNGTSIGGKLTTGNPSNGAGPSGGFPIASGSKKGGKAHCKHVIDLLVRNCVQDRRHYNPCLRPHYVDPIWVEVGFIPAAAVAQPAQPVVAEAPIVDLELLSVEAVADGDAQSGPIYAVTYRNNSQIDVQQFRISLVAVLGEIDENSPTTTVEVPAMAAGEVAVVQIQLPVSAMMMGSDQQPLAFDTLVAAIDSFDDVPESDEANNVAILSRTEIALPQPAEQVEAVEATPTQVAPLTTEPLAAPSASGKENHFPLAENDLDRFDLVDGDGAAVRLDR